MSGKDLPDPRRHAYRGDLAAEALRGVVKAERYVQGEARQVAAPVLPLRREPRFAATSIPSLTVRPRRWLCSA